MELLVAIYQENNEVYAALGLTREECLAIVNETMVRTQLRWQTEPEESAESDEKTEAQAADKADGSKWRSIRAQRAEDSKDMEFSASILLGRLIDWGWLKSDFDEKMNSYVISFPEYSQLFTELFQKLQREDDSRERESILSVYSALYTFHSDQERNNDILRNALQTSKGLGQLLSNMQDGMRAYFDKLSKRKNFIGIQEVLVEEINNSDSRRYAILTTTDSFYRYKEAVKELISQILNENDNRKLDLEREQSSLQQGTLMWMRGQRAIELCEETNGLIYKIDREFDQIEQKYNKLINQKTIFAKRALARVRYILQEGVEDADILLRLFRILEQRDNPDEVLKDLRGRLKFSAQFGQLCDASLYSRREKTESEFRPVTGAETEGPAAHITDFVPRPLYTRKELDDFRLKNTSDGKFRATQDTVHSVEDLEKLLFLWQQETGAAEKTGRIVLEDEVRTAEGFTFSGLTIEEEKHA